MEANGKHNFDATQEDELSFRAGDTLKLINIEEDKNWYKAELNGREGFIPKNYIEFKQPVWYAGKILRKEAEDRLMVKDAQGRCEKKDGNFLIRVSETSPNDFSLSVKSQDSVQHFRVLRDQCKWYLWVQRFDSLNELVHHHKTASVSRTASLFLVDNGASSELNSNGDNNNGNPPEPTEELCVALYDFESQDDEELSLRRGDVVIVVEREDTNWWFVKHRRTGQTGLVPSNYITPQTE